MKSCSDFDKFRVFFGFSSHSDNFYDLGCERQVAVYAGIAKNWKEHYFREKNSRIRVSLREYVICSAFKKGTTPECELADLVSIHMS